MSSTFIKSMFDMISSLKKIKKEMSDAIFENEVNNTINQITQDITNKLGGSDGTTESLYPGIHTLITKYVRHSIFSEELDTTQIMSGLKNVAMAYLFNKSVTLLISAEIPIASGVVGAYRTASSVCKNADEFKTILKNMALDNIIPFINIPEYVCLPITLINSAGSMVAYFWGMILSLNFLDPTRLQLAHEILFNHDMFSQHLHDYVLIKQTQGGKRYQNKHLQKPKKKTKRRKINKKRNIFTRINKY